MKKIMLFAAALAAFAACNKNIDTINPESAPAFEKGQKVTLTVGTDNQTKVSSALNATSGAIDFKWESGDQIKVTVGSNSANFTLKTGAGESTATFEGTMPEGGSSFDVQYPVTDPEIASQTYSSGEAIPQDKMLFKATGCTIAESSFTLDSQNAALRLNLWGTSKTISKIEVKDASSNTYTLTMNPAVTLPTSEADAKAFFVVVPAGSYQFSAEIFDNAATPASICKFETTAAKTFTAGQILNMPAKEVVEATPVTGIQLNPTSKTLLVGDSGIAAPTVEITPSNATDKTCTWTSNNTSVVTVDSATGALTAVGTGETTVTVTANGGDGVSTTLNVAVIDKTIEITVPQLAAANDWENDCCYNTATYGLFTFTIDNGWDGKYEKDPYDEGDDKWIIEGNSTVTISHTLFNITNAFLNFDEEGDAYKFKYSGGNASYQTGGQTFMNKFTLTLSSE